MPTHPITEGAMSRIRSLWILLGVLVVFLGCQANESTMEPIVDRIHVHLQEPIVLQKGEVGDGVIRIEIKEGYHVQANPVPLPYLIPTYVEIDDGSGFLLRDVEYPAGKLYSLLGSPDTLLVYDGDVAIKYTIEASSAVPAGMHEVDVAVTFQACDDRMCFPPVREKIGVRLIVEAG